MKFTTRGRYGIRAIAYIAENSDKGPVPLSKIASNLQLSENYLEQLLRLLKKDGLLISERGAQGGYYISRSPKKIYLGDIINSLEGKSFSSICTDKSNKCEILDCPTRKVALKLDNAISDVIDNYSLYDIMEKDDLK